METAMSMPNKQQADPPTTERLRADIDRGRTGEKVRYPDPAAAPLGADDEAGGTPPTAEQRQQENENRTLHEAPHRREPGSLALYALLIVGIALVVIGALALIAT